MCMLCLKEKTIISVWVRALCLDLAYAQVWESNLAGRLKIRPPTQHKTCSECTRHKYIIRKCGCNRLAAAAQTQQWSNHLKKQYMDRTVYWDLRAQSRLGHDEGGRPVLTIIMDSMDRSKWCVPRTSALQSKQLAPLRRPVLDLTACICHGKLLAIYFAEPSIVKGSSWTCEILMNVFHTLSTQGIDLREYSVVLHGDNCSKEVKSNSVARLLALLVARRRLRHGQLQTLMTGHSHEDVDAFFGLLGSWLQSQSELHDPQMFEDAVAKFLSNNSVRPEEPVRIVQRVSRVRDWTRGLFIVAVFASCCSCCSL